MNKKVFSAIALSVFLPASPGFAQTADYQFFFGIAAGAAKYRDEGKTLGRLRGLNYTRAALEKTGTGYKATIGVEGEKIIAGIDYFDWGKFDGQTHFGDSAATIPFTLDLNSYGPWVGYKIDGAYSYYNLHIIPKIGYAFSDFKGRVNPFNIIDDDDGLLYGIALDFETSDRLSVIFAYDATDAVSLASVGLRYRLTRKPAR